MKRLSLNNIFYYPKSVTFAIKCTNTTSFEMNIDNWKGLILKSKRMIKIPRIDKYFFKKIKYWVEKNIQKKQFIKIMGGPLKGYFWRSDSNYQFVVGNYEPSTVDFLLSHIPNDGVFLDLGTNAGYFSILINESKANSSVFAFEPSTKAIQFIKAHIEKNKINRLKLYECAVCETNKDIYFTESEYESSNTYIENSTNPIIKDSKRRKVEGISLDFFTAKEKLHKIDLIKIDVEGAEADVLIGAKNTILTYKPIILLSTHNLYLEGIDEKCKMILDSYNYNYSEYYYFKFEGLNDYLCMPIADK